MSWICGFCGGDWCVYFMGGDLSKNRLAEWGGFVQNIFLDKKMKVIENKF